jgi:hypothetical protein
MATPTNKLPLRRKNAAEYYRQSLWGNALRSIGTVTGLGPAAQIWGHLPSSKPGSTPTRRALPTPKPKGRGR